MWQELYATDAELALERLPAVDEQADHQPMLPGLPELPGALMDEHPIIRPLSDYGRLVHGAFLQPRSPMEQRA
jgi:hypothetical protein